MDWSTRIWYWQWRALQQRRALAQRVTMRVLLWRMRWQATLTRGRFLRMRVQSFCALWRFTLRILRRGGSSPMAWAIVLCPPLLVLWPVLWLGLHLVLR